MIQRRQLTLGLLAAPAAWTLAACGQKDEGAGNSAPQATQTPIAPDQAYATVAAEGKGFSVGLTMAARPVYVFFDPQCPHCGHLWQAAQPLLGQARFVWLPVGFIGPKSVQQGAALLQAAQPQEAMTAHEVSLLAGRGGIEAPATVPPELVATIKRNTELLNRMGAESVPYIVAASATGQPLLKAGAMDTAALASLLGLS